MSFRSPLKREANSSLPSPKIRRFGSVLAPSRPACLLWAKKTEIFQDVWKSIALQYTIAQQLLAFLHRTANPRLSAQSGAALQLANSCRWPGGRRQGHQIIKYECTSFMVHHLMARHLMVRHSMLRHLSKRHLQTLYSVKKTRLDTTLCQ